MSNNNITYNGITLDWTKTNRFEQEAIYDDSHTDYIMTHITINVTGVLSNCLQGMQPWEWVKLNRPYLMATRGELIFNCDGTNITMSPNQLLLSAPTGVDNDAMLGPKPKYFNIIRMDGSTWFFQYEIETWIVDCGGPTLPSQILNNRWEASYNVDADYYGTRTINGVVIFNGYYGGSDNLNYADNETIIIPTIPAGWKRESVNVTLSPDGLKLNYTIADKATHFAMPKPAVSIDMTYQETAGLGKFADLHIQQNEVNVTVRGEPGSQTVVYQDANGVNQNGRVSSTVQQLLQIMFQLVLSRINPDIKQAMANPPPSVSEFITYFHLKENTFKNEYSCRVITLKTRDPQNLTAGQVIDWTNGGWGLTRVGLPIKIDDITNNVPRTPDNVGNYLMWVFANSVQTPCENTNDDSIDDEYSDTYTTQTIVPVDHINVYTSQPNVTPSPTANTNNDYSENHYKFPFVEWTADVTYPQDYHCQQFPVMYDQAPNCVLIKTAANTLRKIIHWKASRVGDWPIVPDPTNMLTDPTTGMVQDQIINTQVSLGNVEVEGDGFTRRYTKSGIYEYAMWKPIDYAHVYTLYAAVNPITQDEWDDYPTKDDNTHFVAGIIANGDPPGGGVPI